MILSALMTSKKKAVGVQFLSKDDKGKLVAILQVRSKWNAEKNSPESWSGACQVTAHGKLEEGENFIHALFREIKEELGSEVADVVQKTYDSGRLIELTNIDSPETQIITYGTIVDENIFKTLINTGKSPTFGGFKIIRREDI